MSGAFFCDQALLFLGEWAIGDDDKIIRRTVCARMLSMLIPRCPDDRPDIRPSRHCKVAWVSPPGAAEWRSGADREPVQMGIGRLAQTDAFGITAQFHLCLPLQADG
jgi:hypothetical protein